MTSVKAIVEDVQARLAAIPACTIYTGYVPKTVPMLDATGIKPYVVIWVGDGQNPIEEDLGRSGAGIIVDLTLTVAATDLLTVVEVSRHVRSALRYIPCPGGGEYRQQPNGAVVQADPAVSPARHYLPLEYQAVTAY